MKEKLIRFMQGRYGADQFTRFLIGVSCVCMFLSIFSKRHILYYLALIILLFTYYRVLSKNHTARYKENQAYLKYLTIFKNTLHISKEEQAQRKQYHIYRCPKCRQKIRIPRGKGKIAVTCPKCHTEFMKKS